MVRPGARKKTSVQHISNGPCRTSAHIQRIHQCNVLWRTRQKASRIARDLCGNGLPLIHEADSSCARRQPSCPLFHPSLLCCCHPAVLPAVATLLRLLYRCCSGLCPAVGAQLFVPSCCCRCYRGAAALLSCSAVGALVLVLCCWCCGCSAVAAVGARMMLCCCCPIVAALVLLLRCCCVFFHCGGAVVLLLFLPLWWWWCGGGGVVVVLWWWCCGAAQRRGRGVM